MQKVLRKIVVKLTTPIVAERLEFPPIMCFSSEKVLPLHLQAFSKPMSSIALPSRELHLSFSKVVAATTLKWAIIFQSRVPHSVIVLIG